MDDGLRRKILSLLDEHRIMTVATLRRDGWPQATAVGCQWSAGQPSPAGKADAAAQVTSAGPAQ
jgi:hypothetical protein